MKIRIVLAAGLLAVPLAARADDPPVIDHQPAPCTVPEKAISLCAGNSFCCALHGAAKPSATARVETIR